MHARSKGQPSDGQPSCSAQTQQQRQRNATSARQPEARPARPEDLCRTRLPAALNNHNTRANARHTTLGNNWLLKTAKQRRWRPWWWHRRLRHWRQRASTSSKTKAPTDQAAPWPLTTWCQSLYVPVCPPARLAAAAAARPHTPAGHRRSDCAARRCGLQLQRAVDAVLAAGLSACGRRLVASARARSSDKSRGSRSVMLGTRHRASVAKRAQGRSRMHQSEPLRQYASRILASPSLLKTKKKFILTHKYDSMSF